MRGGKDEPLQSVKYDFDREQEGGIITIALAGDLGFLLDSEENAAYIDSKPGSSIKKKGGMLRAVERPRCP